MTYQLQNAMNSARNDDISKTNSMILDYVKLAPCEMLLEYDTATFLLPSLNWSHPEYAVLLCPNVMLDCFSPNDYE